MTLPDSGVEEGNENGIRAMVRQCVKFGATREQIITILVDDFNLDETTAARKYEMYSK